MMDELWQKCYCEACSKINWVYLGDADNNSLRPISGIRCYSCDYLNWLIPSDELAEYNDCLEEDLKIVLSDEIIPGLEQPT